MRRFLVGAVCGVVATAAVAGVWGVMAGMVAPRLVQEVCEPGAGTAGWCVQLRDDGSPGGQLQVRRMHQTEGRYSYVASPFTDLEHGTGETIDVTFEPGRIVVHGHDGSRLILTEEFYATND